MVVSGGFGGYTLDKMTEKQWLEQSDCEKNKWIDKNICENDFCTNCLRSCTACSECEYDYLTYQGFGMIVEKCDHINLIWATKTTARVELWNDEHRPREFDALGKPWEAAALAYGKMKGLIE